MPGTDPTSPLFLNVDGVGPSDQDRSPRGARWGRADTFVRALMEHELDRLMAGHSTDPGLRLRVLMRMADQLRPAR